MIKLQLFWFFTIVKKKVAFVTGGSGGIGKSICLKLIKSGFYVAIGYDSLRVSFYLATWIY